jgi:uncharacterized glyoxalase superfamily protein PhnB
VENFAAMHDRLVSYGVTITSPPRSMPYGDVLVFQDLCGNKWDLLGPALQTG